MGTRIREGECDGKSSLKGHKKADPKGPKHGQTKCQTQSNKLTQSNKVISFVFRIRCASKCRCSLFATATATGVSVLLSRLACWSTIPESVGRRRQTTEGRVRWLPPHSTRRGLSHAARAAADGRSHTQGVWPAPDADEMGLASAGCRRNGSQQRHGFWMVLWRCQDDYQPSNVIVYWDGAVAEMEV